MGKSIYVLALSLMLSAGLGAQVFTPADQAVKVHFERSVGVGENWLPAGDYSIRPQTTVGGQPVLAIEAEHGGTILVAARRCSAAVKQTAARTEVVLEARGERLYLSTIWLAGRDYGYEVIARR